MARGGSGGGGGGNPGSPNTVLVVFLVLFVLVSIALGVTTYMGYNDQAQLVSDKDKAVSDKKKADADADWFKFQAYLSRMAIGEKLNDDDVKAFGNLKTKFDGGSLKTGATDARKEDGNTAMTTLLAHPTLKFLPKDNKFDSSFPDVIKAQQTDIDAMKVNLAKTQEKLKATEKDVEDGKESLLAEKELFKKALAANTQDKSGALKVALTERDNLRNKLADLGKELEELTAKLGQVQEDNEKQLVKLNREKKQLENTVEKLQGQVSSVNIFDYDQAKGKIVQIDRDGSMPFINLGSADNLKPGVTFSVYGVGLDGKPVAHNVLSRDGQPIIGTDGKADKEGKATVEVLAVLGPHTSQVRVTSLRDGTRDPILRGDLIFNPVWNPNLQQRVAITGLIDLNGDGADDQAEFQRMLEKNRVVVDAYLDLRDVAMKGSGITRQTDFLVLGDVPEIPGAFLAKDDDPRSKRLNAIIAEMTKMQEDAKRDGVTIISLRKFLTLSGYKVPKLSVTSEGQNPIYRSPLQPKEPAKPMPMPKPEDKPPMGDNPPKP